MALIDRYGWLLARIFLGLLFVPSGFGKLTQFERFAGSLARQGVPAPHFFAAAGVFCEFGVAILVLLGFRVRLTAPLLAGFTICAAFIGHHFWTFEGADWVRHFDQFWKDFSIATLLMLMARHGPGVAALDGLSRPTARLVHRHG
jgi:putative oxidoreductase